MIASKAYIDFWVDLGDLTKMLFDPAFLAAVATSDVCTSYYALCDDYPLRLNVPMASLSKKAILDEAVANSLTLEKLSGPGTVFRLSSLPAGLSLNVIVQGRGSLETDFVVRFAESEQQGTLATLCHSARIFSGHSAYQPPYPRPTCLSVGEVVTVMDRLGHLVRMLGATAGCASGR